MKVNKMTSQKTLMPIEYYKLDIFCDEGHQMDNENLGEFLAGDRIESSPYRLLMKTDMFCEQVCVKDFSKQGRKKKADKLIKRQYHNNFIVDNLSSGTIVEDEKYISTKYYEGFPVGFVKKSGNSGDSYIHNHVNLSIMYHKVESAEDSFRIVRFTVEPFSINHKFEVEGRRTKRKQQGDGKNDDAGASKQPVKITNPIPSCKQNGFTEHTNYDMVHATGRKPQLASGNILFTYDVIWEENPDLHWASRWDIYLSMNNAFPAKVHWFNIAYSLIIVFVLSAMIAAILVRNLRRDYARYNKLATDEEKAEDLEEFGWKLVHADVFRPPSFSPMLLSVCCGTGAQLLCMAIITIIFATMGFLSPANRGALLMAQLLVYVLMGSVGGYTTARLYKTFKGKAWQKATTVMALGFPGVSFCVFFVMNIVALSQGSSDAVPFTTMLVLLVLWFGISSPLVFFGAYFGYKQEAIEFPVGTSSIPRQIPDQPWFMGIPFTLLVGGILPFGACFFELYFILSSVWRGQYYYVFGFLLLVCIILLVTCAEITVLFTYFSLCGENYHWWWRSFCTGGSTAIYVFLYSFMYFNQLEASKTAATYVLYFGYMALASLGLFLMMGFVGVASSLWFNRTIFASIKID